MKFDNIKVISCDIDATLTASHRSDLSEYNRRALNDLMDRGIKVGLASGRAYEDLREYPVNWKLKKNFDFYIGLNGASLYDEEFQKNEVFFEIVPEHIEPIVKAIDALDLDCHIYVDGLTLFSKASDKFLNVKKVKHRNVRVVEDLREMWERNTSKILINCGDERMEEMRSYFKPVLEGTGNTVKLVRTSPGCMEFVPYEANKLYALKIYGKRHHIDMKDVAAFGDTSNDNEMIEGAGLGVCMENGTDDTKTLADLISEYPAGEDGFARFVYEHIL